MKTIRYFAALLLLVTGVLHLLPMFKVPRDPNALPMLAFGIAYFTVGVLLILNKRVSQILGIAFPLIGLAVGFFIIGMKNWDSMLTIMFIIDAVVVICCIIMILNRNKVSIESQ
ncbi:MAG: hypothetical protein WCS03_17760 [Bacteroidota bacterium]